MTNKLLFFIILFSLYSCSRLKTVQAPLDTAAVEKTTQPLEIDNPRSKVSTDEMISAVTEIGLPLKSGIQNYSSIRMNLSSAILRINTNLTKKAQGTLLVKKLSGSDECKIKMTASESKLILTDYFQQNIRCKFQIDLVTTAAAALELEVAQGDVTIQNWSEKIFITMNSGDFDFESINNLELKCDDCSVSGSGLTGLLKYSMISGNIGIENLEATVEGSTLGDTVLKWNKIAPGSKINVLAKSGDIFLKFPQKTKLSLNLKIPKGEFNTNLNSGDIVQNSSEMTFGVPLTVTAETGNVRIVH